MKKTAELKRKIEQFKALELLESKTKDLPTYEARKLKKIFAESTTDEIEDKFDKVIFLDIDGVLNDDGDRRESGEIIG